MTPTEARPLDMKNEPAIHRVTLPLCELCLTGSGGECHSPGCVLYLNRAPDLPLAKELVQHAPVTNAHLQTRVLHRLRAKQEKEREAERARLLDLLRRALPCVEMRLACPSLAADIRAALGTPCQACEGRGNVPAGCGKEQCSTCGGEGVVRESQG